MNMSTGIDALIDFYQNHKQVTNNGNLIVIQECNIDYVDVETGLSEYIGPVEINIDLQQSSLTIVSNEINEDKLHIEFKVRYQKFSYKNGVLVITGAGKLKYKVTLM